MKQLDGNKFNSWMLAIDPWHPEKEIVCPTCKRGKLKVEIHDISSQAQSIVVSCPICDAWTHTSPRGTHYPVTTD